MHSIIAYSAQHIKAEREYMLSCMLCSYLQKTVQHSIVPLEQKVEREDYVTFVGVHGLHHLHHLLEQHGIVYAVISCQLQSPPQHLIGVLPCCGVEVLHCT